MFTAARSGRPCCQQNRHLKSAKGTVRIDWYREVQVSGNRQFTDIVRLTTPTDAES